MVSSPQPRSAIANILAGGLVAGTVDLGAAALLNWVSPVFIARYVAIGVLGRQSLDMGTPSALLGVVLQWLMSILIAAIYAVGTRQLPRLRSRWVLGGLAYGIVVFFVMNYVVLPLSRVGHIAHFTPATFVENLLAMELFGLIVAYFLRGAQRARQ
jgi:uncharacterized membrane protein YagU involved in acid resistance